MAATLPEVVGRDEELAAVVAFLESTAVLPGALLLEGDPGIGKTTLWRAGIEAARELSYGVLRASPAEPEASFAYSVVSDLLEDVLDEVLTGSPSLSDARSRWRFSSESPKDPRPNRRRWARRCSVRCARSRRRGRSWSPWTTSSGSIFVCRHARVRRPAAREERVALLLARRRRRRDPERLELALPEDRRLAVPVGPLSLGALHRLLRDRLRATFPRPMLRRVHEASGGNPFYALELVRALPSSTGLIPGDPLPVPRRWMRSFASASTDCLRTCAKSSPLRRQ